MVILSGVFVTTKYLLLGSSVCIGYMYQVIDVILLRNEMVKLEKIFLSLPLFVSHT